MATSKLMTTKDGRRYYKISISRGYGISPYTERWYPPEGWSKRAEEAGLKKAIHDFQTRVDNGEVKSRKEIKEERARAEEERAMIKTLRQFTEQVFMPELTITCSEHTRDNYQRMLNTHIFPALGEMKIPEIKPVQITAFLNSLQTEKGLKPASRVKVYTILLSIFKKAYKYELISRNPMDLVDRPKASKDEGKDTELKTFTENELIYIQRCLDSEPLKWRALIRLMMDTGCREGEICGLKWKSVNKGDNSIKIENNLGYTKDMGIYDTTPKNGKTRTIYIAPEVMELIEQYKKSKSEKEVNGKTIKVMIKPSDYVFTQDDSFLPMHPQSPTRYLNKFGKKYGIKDCHPHKLRHSFASVAITNGADIASVSEILGHTDKATTLRMYTHADEESKKRASDVFRLALKSKAEA